MKVKRELEDVDEFIAASKVRQPGQTMALPRSGKLLENLAEANKLNLLDDNNRKTLKTELKKLVEHAPVIHISFASSPSGQFLDKITGWFRENIHSSMLLEIGLQPSIAAGCRIRTNSRYFDMSLQQYLTDKQALLTKELRGDGSEHQ